jgi:hypothetical protein
MAVTIACPHCSAKLQILPEHGGQTLACPKCQGAFIAPRLAAPKPVVTAPIIQEPAPAENSGHAPVSSDSSPNDPFGFLNKLASQGARSAPPVHGLPTKSKSFMDTIAAAAGNLFASQPPAKKAQPGITAARIGKKLKGLPPAAKLPLLGCGGLLVLLVLCSGLLTIGNRHDTTSKPTSAVSIQGITANLDVVVASGTPFIDNLKNAAFVVANQVYNVAKANPRIKTIKVMVKMNKDSGGGLSDKYGHRITEDIEMGTLVIDELDEVRKYVDPASYGVDDSVRAYYMAEIRNMKYGNLLTQ